MSFDKKTPSCRVKLSIESYNRLIELLTKVDGINNDEIKERGLDIKEKLLRYSEPKDGDVNCGFYPSQIKDVLNILLHNARPVVISNDYYRTLLDNRKRYAEYKSSEKGE